MLFEETDLKLLKVLINLLAHKVKFDGMDVKDVSSAYHCMEFLNKLESKMRQSNNLEIEMLDLEELNQKLEEEIKAMESEPESIEEEKPKRRNRRKQS